MVLLVDVVATATYQSRFCLFLRAFLVKRVPWNICQSVSLCMKTFAVNFCTAFIQGADGLQQALGLGPLGEERHSFVLSFM